MRIQTIHGFCESVLKRFPIEAGLSPQFKLLDEQQARAMQADLVRAQINTDDPERRASIARLTRHLAEDAMARLAGDILNHRDKFPANDAIEARLENIARSMDLPDWAFDVEALLRAHAEADLPDVTPRIQAGSQASAKADRAQGERLESWAERARGGTHASAWPFLESVFMTKEGNPRARLVTAAFAGAHASVAEALIHQADDIAVLRNRLNAAQALALTDDIYRFAADLITAYETSKTRLGVLDYDDLIVCTNRLLNSRSATQWVLFKIDRGLEHILVDEAQDTSPAQWQVIAALAEEFFAGDAAHAEPRTVFAVGDEKQSIYSFQGLTRQGLKNARPFRRENRGRGRHDEFCAVDRVAPVCARNSGRGGFGVCRTRPRRGADGRWHAGSPHSPPPERRRLCRAVGTRSRGDARYGFANMGGARCDAG